MKPQQQKQTYWRMWIILLALIFVTFGVSSNAMAGLTDVKLGVVNSQTQVDFSTIDETNFDSTFTYEGESTASITIGGNVEAQIGAIYTGGEANMWYQIRIMIDSNGDGEFDPFNWGDASHPWNRPDNGTPENPDDDPTTWDYTYPEGYPMPDLVGETITMTWNTENSMVEGFPWDTFQMWWYESDSDKTDMWWMEKGKLMNSYFSGRDQNWHMLPNGDYKVKIHVDENDDGEFGETEAQKLMIIAVETASITGIVKDMSDPAQPLAGARIEAGSHMAWGETKSKSDGTFVLSGLQAGAQYHVRVQSDGKVTHEAQVELSENASSVDMGTVQLSEAITISGTLKLDLDSDGTAGEIPDDQFVSFTNMWGWEQQDMWVWVDAWNKQGPGWGNTNVRFEVGDAEMDFAIDIPPPSQETTFQVNFHAEGYAATPVDVTVNSSGGTLSEDVVLTKASILTGTVRLPEATEMWSHIDIQAVSTTDSGIRYWGWGNIDPNAQELDPPGSTDLGTYRIDGILPGTYDLEIRVMGYAMTRVEDVTVTQGEDTVVAEKAITEGLKISGTLTITGDTTSLKRWEGDSTDGKLDIWIDAWSPSGGWSGTNVQVDRGVNQSVAYSLGGLSDGTYEVHTWIGEGFELTDENGNVPVIATLSGASATKNIVLREFEGIVNGTITASGITLDLSKVVVEVKRPWGWLPPKIATVGNGKINASTGAYSISGFGTGDYIVKVGMYRGYNGQETDNMNDYDGNGFLMPSSVAGVVIHRVFIQNDASSPTTKNIALERGYNISGTITLSTTDAPWHDFGDGTFEAGGGGSDPGGSDPGGSDPGGSDPGGSDPGGSDPGGSDPGGSGPSQVPAGDPDGIPNSNADPMLSEYISMDADIEGRNVMAMPMDMMFMGGSDPRKGRIDENGNFSIKGLAPGVYIIMPPFSSNRISMMTTTDGQMNFFDGGQETHHWTVGTQMVVVSNDDIEEVDFELGNGHTVTGTLTLPEAQTVTETWEEYMWVGHLEMETATHQFLGHGKPIFKTDFDGTSRYEFTFHHVANGDYLMRFWTDRYVPGSAKFTVNNANATVKVTVEKGANLVGKLIDADTGEAITSDDGVRVIGEANPWVEGSWRETRNDDWSQSYIENPDFQQKSFGGENGERENKTPGKFHLTAVPTGHKYIVRVEAEHGKKTNGAKNYVGVAIAGIDVPEGATGDIDVGTIELKEGTTIKGQLTDSDGNPIPGIEVFAEPSDSHDGSSEAEGVSDTQGYYILYGVDPNVEYYDIFAAERPFMFEDWGKVVEWGEKRKYNIAPGTTGVNFTLQKATSSLTGTITIPEGATFGLPFKGEGEDFPAAMILLQKKGVIFEDMMDGIEGSSNPAPSGITTSTYTIDNITPGTYKMIVMNYGLPTMVTNEVVIEAGANTKDITWTSTGFTISGSVALAEGGYPSSSDINGSVVMNTSDQSITFGMLTQEADGTYSAYEVPGLATGATYQLVFFKDSGFDDTPEIYTSGEPFTVSADITENAATINRNPAPIMMVQAIQRPSDATKVDIGIFSTSYLVDRTIEVVTETAPTAETTAGEIYVSTGSGTLSDVTLSGDKRTIRAVYTKADEDTDVTVLLAVHYGADATTKLETVTFNVNTVATNSDSVSTYLSGQVKLGNGDASQIYIPAGSLDTSDDGKAIVMIEKSDEEPGTLEGSSYQMASGLGKFAQTATKALPTGVTVAGSQYDFSYAAATDDATITQQGSVTVQVQYDPTLVTDVDELQIMHFTGGEWVQESTNRTVDTENYTISVDVTSLSPFLPALVETTDTGGGTDTGGNNGVSSGGGGGGGCFISSVGSEGPTSATTFIAIVFFSFLLMAVEGIRKRK